MPHAEEYLAISSSGRVVGGPFRYHSEADSVAKRHGGYVQFVAKEEGDASAMEVVPVLHEGGRIESDCVAIVERKPGCASGGVEVKTAADVYKHLHERYRRTGQEVFEVILLNLRSEMIGSPIEVAKGQRDRVAVDVEQVVAVVVAGTSAGAVGAVLVHLHPSGHATPSPADRRLTDAIRSAMKVAAPNTKLVDHVVIAPRAKKKGEFYSFTDDKLYRATDVV
jgi:DNA repair protein RadC